MTLGQAFEHIQHSSSPTQLQDSRENSRVRLSFSNYLRYFLTPQTQLTPSILQAFYLNSLQFDHWWQNRQAFKSELLLLAEEFKRMDAAFAKEEVEQLLAIQVLTLENKKDWERLIHQEDKAPNAQIKVQWDLENQPTVLILHPNGSLDVRTYSTRAYIEDGVLQLFPPVTQLSYGKDLNLLAETPQIVVTGPNTTACFQIHQDICRGSIVRGYTYQAFQNLNGVKLNQVGDLFYAVRRFEQMFIRPESDPLYVELKEYLERVGSLLRSGHPEGAKAAELACRRGHMALEKIFPNDRMLSLLVTDIEYSLLKLNQKEAEWPVNRPSDSYDSTNTSQTAALPADVKQIL